MQIFQTPLCNIDFFDFLNTICLRTDKYFLFDSNAFKKMVYQNSYEEFKELLKQHYYPSKKHYLDRKLTYTSFTTIIRHICKSNHISYSSETKYSNSNYNIVYYIYFD